MSDGTPQDDAMCERARRARDRRFDGRFYVGVLTTGIYCRPICPARHARRENVRFFASAAAARSAGLRPCLRCRPEASPGAPAARGTEATVTRALRLIESGALSDDGIDALAARLGVGARHLSRLFIRHLGASPIRVAQTHRLHLAVQLLRETELPVAQVAAAAGFGSVRRMNELVRATYDRPPSALRSSWRGTRGSGLTLTQSYRPPLAWDALCDHLATRAIAGVEHVADGVYRRTVCVDGRTGWIELGPAAGSQLPLRVELPGVTGLADVVARARTLLDLDADPASIDSALAQDPALAGMVAHHPGLRVPGTWDPFELSVRAVLGQAISVVAARTLASRLVARLGSLIARGTAPDGLSHVFPSPAVLAEADLTSIGVTAHRAAALRGLARLAADGHLAAALSRGIDDVVAALTAIPGVGPWTAQYIALRSGRHPDAFPHADLGLLRGAEIRLARPERSLTAPALLALAERWRPWRGYAAMHLWRAYADRGGRGRAARTTAPAGVGARSGDERALLRTRAPGATAASAPRTTLHPRTPETDATPRSARRTRARARTGRGQRLPARASDRPLPHAARRDHGRPRGARATRL